MHTYKGLWFMAAAGALLVTAGCKDTRETGAVTTRTPEGTSATPSAETAEKRNVAMVRVINAIPGAAVTIWAGDTASFADVNYKTVTKWREVPDDRFNFQIKTSANAEPLAENREHLQDGEHYTIVALPDQGGADKRNLRVLNDDLKPVPPEKARIRFINGVPSDTDVDLIMIGREDPFFDGVNFKTEAGWTEVDPISGTLLVRPDNKANTLARLANVKLEGGKSYTFVLSGRPGKVELIKIEDDVAPTTGEAWDTNTARTRVEAR